MHKRPDKGAIIFGVVAATVTSLYSLWQSSKERHKRKEREEEFHKQFGGVGSTSVTNLPNGNQVLRFRGSFDDFMTALHPERAEERPPLPADLDVDSLPEYHCGCPHCGNMSMVGEDQWRYRELSRTRGYLDNTTTFLCRCQKCNGLMRSTVDHDYS